jgi:hypothetical protein
VTGEEVDVESPRHTPSAPADRRGDPSTAAPPILRTEPPEVGEGRFGPRARQHRDDASLHLKTYRLDKTFVDSGEEISHLSSGLRALPRRWPRSTTPAGRRNETTKGAGQCQN